MTLNQASTKQWLKEAMKRLPRWARVLSVINQQLWCCCGDAGIVVFDSELQQQRTIPAADMGDVWDVAETTNGDVVIAATNGLHHRHNGEYS